jgi:hypothetical protein
MKNLLLMVSVFSLLGVATHVQASTETYTITGFRDMGDKCVASVSVAISGSPSVTKTTITGTSSSKKPSNVNLKVNTTSDDTTPSGKDGSWSAPTNAFNGSSFKNGKWRITITKALGAKYTDYNGTTLTFEYF